MLEEKDRWDIMLVMKMDRIHRNSKNFMIMMESLEKWGKKFTSMNESLDTSNAVGRFVVDIIQRIAQLESEQIGERTYMGMRQKAESMDRDTWLQPAVWLPYGWGELGRDGGRKGDCPKCICPLSFWKYGRPDRQVPEPGFHRYPTRVRNGRYGRSEGCSTTRFMLDISDGMV